MLTSWLCRPHRKMLSRGATILEYVFLIIFMGVSASYFMRGYAAPIIQSLLVAFSQNFARFPN